LSSVNVVSESFVAAKVNYI